MNAQKLTKKALEAVQSAQSIAIENQNMQIMPEHLLYALVDQEGGLIPQLLKKSGIDTDNMLALLDGALIGSFSSLDRLIEELSAAADALCPSVISVYYGEDVEAGDAEATAGSFGAHFPDAELTVVNGGQPVYYYMISIE